MSLFLQRKWRRPLRFPNSNVHQTGLAPISDESAHNQGKKAKNLRYPYPSDIVLKKENNKNLYKGKIKEKNIENIDFGILKKEEI